MQATVSRDSYYRGPSRITGSHGSTTHRAVEHRQGESFAPIALMLLVGLVLVAKVR